MNIYLTDDILNNSVTYFFQIMNEETMEIIWKI